MSLEIKSDNIETSLSLRVREDLFLVDKELSKVSTIEASRVNFDLGSTLNLSDLLVVIDFSGISKNSSSSNWI